MRFFIETLGCKVNQYESLAIAEKLCEKGYEQSRELNNADIIIINTCSVTAESERKACQLMRRARKLRPESVIVLTGCMTEREPSKKACAEADIITGNKDKLKLTEYIGAFLESSRKINTAGNIASASGFEEMRVTKHPERVRAVIKIQDGCNSFCSYCIIPYVRGRPRSKDVGKTLEEIRANAENGMKEIVLSGIHLDKYGEESGAGGLSELLNRIERLPGDFRLRLGSLDPTFITPDSVSAMKNMKKLCPHFHLSLQSGSDRILKLMNRKYTSAEFLRSVRLIYENFCGALITTDIITGFPTETEDDFQDSLVMVNQAAFLKTHVFPYSDRPGTKASEMEGKIDTAIKKQRAAALIKAAEAVTQNVLLSQKGKRSRLLVEEIKEGFAYGYTDNYIYVKTEAGALKVGDFAECEIGSFCGDYCIAKPV